MSAGMAAGQGALAGAGTGASVGAFFGPPGAAIGAGLGALAGGIGGYFAGKADEEEAARQQAALEAAEREYDNAVNEYENSVANAAAGANEMFKQTMTAKGAADASAVKAAISEAERSADSSGLIGAEKADAVSKTRESVEQARASSSPAVANAALAAANQSKAADTQRAGMALQAAGNKYNTSVAQISGQQTGGNAAALGSTLGSITQVAGALHGAGVDFKGKDATPKVSIEKKADTPLGGSAAKSSAPTSVDMWKRDYGEQVGDPLKGIEAYQEGLKTDQEVAAQIGGSMSGTQVSKLGGTGAGWDPTKAQGLNAGSAIVPPEPNLGTSDASGAAWMDYWRSQESPSAFPGTAGVQLATGGMAGTQGPEVALLGEEGPELVLNAKQTRELGEALGVAKPLAMGGVAGYDKKKKMRGYAHGGVAGAHSGVQPLGGQSAGVMSQDPEELEAYLSELLSRAG